jgi:hypothetical protein
VQAKKYKIKQIIKEDIQMKYLKLTLPVVLGVAFCLLLSLSAKADAEQKEDKEVSFRWAFGAIVGPENDRELVAITRDTDLKTGDQIKMYLELEKKCFVYVFYRGSQDEVQMVFPYNLRQFNTDYKTSAKYYIPQGNKWFEMDENGGAEMFYLLASAKRLTELETVYRKYISADPGQKQVIAKQVLAKIREIKKRNRKFTTVAERPVAIGGNVRGFKVEGDLSRFDVATLAVEISATDFFSRTFTIEHK